MTILPIEPRYNFRILLNTTFQIAIINQTDFVPEMKSTCHTLFRVCREKMMIPTAEVAERAARMSLHRDLSNTVTIWKKAT